jgi:hypothetical protein
VLGERYFAAARGQAETLRMGPKTASTLNSSATASAQCPVCPLEAQLFGAAGWMLDVQVRESLEQIPGNVAANHGCIINHHTDDNQPQSSAFPFQLSAFQGFSFSLVPPSTINPQLLCGVNRLLLQRAAPATLWDLEAGTRVSKVRGQ